MRRNTPISWTDHIVFRKSVLVVGVLAMALTGSAQSPEETPTLGVVEPATEFQQFVEGSTGQMPPIYGASLFNRVPSTYAPVDRVPVSPDYMVGPGDELDVRLWGRINSEQRLVVDRTGDIFIPQVVRVAVAALHYVLERSTNSRKKP